MHPSCMLCLNTQVVPLLVLTVGIGTLPAMPFAMLPMMLGRQQQTCC